MIKKSCSNCKKRKDLTEFGKLSSSKDKRRNTCRLCRKEEIKKYKETSSSYYEKNKETVRRKARERGTIYRLNNKDKINIARKEKYDLYKKTAQKYNIKNKAKIAKKRNETRKIKYHSNPSIKLRQAVSTAIGNALKKNGSKKNSSFLKRLSYSIDELKAHLESLFDPWMNWKNHGKYTKDSWVDEDRSTWVWQLDHIIPQSNLSYTTMNDDNFKLCWSLENLRPLSAKTNAFDGGTRKRHK